MADFNLSYLNRHYILHGMGNEHFYSFSDCNRLFISFDILIEIIGAESNSYKFSIENSTIASDRRKYYSELTKDPNEHDKYWICESVLMSTNQEYVNEDLEKMKKIVGGDITSLEEIIETMIFREKHEN